MNPVLNGGPHPSGVERIAEAFAGARAHRRCAIMPFVTAGFPDRSTTVRLLRELPDAGADLIELGFPFSDPIADGPVIAESMHQALLKGATPDGVFGCVREARPRVPVLAMVSVSIVTRMGVVPFLEQCERSSIAGVIVPDAGAEFWPAARAAAPELTTRLGIVELVAPSTPPARTERIVRDSNAFVYLLARAGITGERNEAPDVAQRAAFLRSFGPAPIAVGFGVSNAAHVRAVGEHAEGAIVGSAIVRAMTDAHARGESAAEAAIALVQSLRA